MKVEIIKKEGFDFIKATLNKEETIYSEPGAFFYSKGNYKVETKTFGGIFSGIKKVLFGGESFFINEYTALEDNVEIGFTSSFPGEIGMLELKNKEFIIKDKAYLMHVGEIELDTKFLGLKGLFSESGLFWLKAKGEGSLFLNTFGNIEVIELKGEEILVDNSNILAYESTLNVELKKFGNWKSFLFGGEGVVFKFSGYGKVLIQTRSLENFVEKIYPYFSK
jgi:uncharacterized protein (TIGR00266 family)